MSAKRVSRSAYQGVAIGLAGLRTYSANRFQGDFDFMRQSFSAQSRFAGRTDQANAESDARGASQSGVLGTHRKNEPQSTPGIIHVKRSGFPCKK